MAKIPIGWRALVVPSKRISTACAVIVRFGFTESWEPAGGYEIGPEVGHLLYKDEGNYDDRMIRMPQVSSLVVAAESPVLVKSHFDHSQAQDAQPHQHQHAASQYDVERGARRHHGASNERR